MAFQHEHRSMRISSTLYYTLNDHLGSASVVTDSAGATVGEQRYYPFGETRLTTGSMYTDKLFTGQREMAGLGIYHFGARFYSPKISRFLSPDTIVPGAANPQAYNRYSYVLNNPIRYNDPTGHMCSDPDDPTPSCDGSGGRPSNPSSTRPLGDSPVRPAPPPGPERNPKPGGGGGELPVAPPTVPQTSTSNACAGPTPSIVCVDHTLLSEGSINTGVVYPRNQPPAGWDGSSAELTGWWVSDLAILLSDWAGRFSYSTWPARISGDSISAQVNYELHQGDYGNFYSLTEVQINSNISSAMYVDNIIAFPYILRPNQELIVEQGTTHIVFSPPIQASSLTINLSNVDNNYYVQLVGNIFR